MFKAWCLTAFTLIGSLVSGDDAAIYSPSPENTESLIVENVLPSISATPQPLTPTDDISLNAISVENIELSIVENALPLISATPQPLISMDDVSLNAISVENIEPPQAQDLSGLIAATDSPAMSKAEECPLGPQSKRFIFRHLEGEGLGFNKGYSSFQAFLSTSEAWWDHFFPFFDLRTHAFNDGRPAANLGLGGRYLFSSGCHAIGGNVYYDFRKTDHHSYNQVGVGLEWLTGKWEVRANGYFPIGNTTSHHFNLEFDHFSNHFLYIRSRNEFAMMGGELEGGWHFNRMGKINLFVGGGSYYFKGKIGHAAIGGKVRFVAKLGKYFTLEATDTYDSVFNNRVNGQLSINFPFGPKSKVKKSNSCSCDRQLMLQEWIYDYPERDEIIVTHSRHKVEKARDSEGNPLFFLFVNNTSSSAGTFQSPFPTLNQAQTASKPGDVIYVFPGDGTTTGMNVGINLKDDQRLLGSGVSHEFLTQLGGMEVPALTEGLPHITGAQPSMTAGTIKLARNNEASGFVIENNMGAGPGIRGEFSGVQTTANLNRNTIFDISTEAIFITMTMETQAKVLVDSNTIFRGSSTQVAIGSIFDSDATITIQNNTFLNSNNNGTEVFANGSSIAPGVPHSVFVNINNNTIIDAGGSGIEIRALGFQDTVITSIFGNNLNYGTTAPGFGTIVIRNQDETNCIVDIWQNTIVQAPTNTGANIAAVRFPSASPSGQLIVRVAANTILGGGDGIDIIELSNGPGFTRATVVGNTLRNLSPMGLFGITLPGAINFASVDVGGTFPPFLQAVVQGNTIDTIGTSLTPLADGITVRSFGGAFTESIMNVDVFANNISNIGRSGINGMNSGGSAQASFTLNNIDHCGLLTATQPAFFYTDAGVTRISVLSNFLQDNLSGDFNVTNMGAGPTCLRLNENVSSFGYTLDNSGGGIFNLETPINNVGTIFPIGTITPVSPGTCN